MVDVQELLDKLKENRLDRNFDPETCNNGEILLYGSALLVCVIVVGAQQCLASRDLAGRGPIVFGTCIATPCTVYTPVFAGLLGACIDQMKSMEEWMYIVMLWVEPFVLLRLAIVARDAMRDGINSRIFPLPLTRRQYWLLLGAVLMHLTLAGAAGGMLAQYRDPEGGSLLVAIEATMLLRTVREPGVFCSEWERLAYAALIGVCLLIGGGGGLAVRKLRPSYLYAWNRACGVPALIQGVMLVLVGATCYELHQPQEEALYTNLAFIAAAATVGSAVAAYRTSGREVGWFYMTVTLYHAGSCIAAAACRIAFDSSGSLLNQGTGNVSFVTLWEARPRGGAAPEPGASLIFGSLALLFLAAIFSIVVFDPDESEPLQPRADMPILHARLPAWWRDSPAKRARAQATAQRQQQRSREDAIEFAEEADDGVAAAIAAVAVDAAARGHGRGTLWRRPVASTAMQRARRSRAAKQTSSRLSGGGGGAAGGAAGGTTAASGGSGVRAEAIIPPPPQRAKRGPAEDDTRMTDAQIAEYYDVVTAGGGCTARRRVSEKAVAENAGRI